MKKILSLFALLVLTVTGAQAQTALMEGYGEPLTLTQFKAMAGTGQRFGFVASSNTAADNAPRCDHWCGFTLTHNTTTLSDDYLFYLEASGDYYKVKRVSDNQYVNTSTSSTTFDADGFEFELINRDPNDATKAVTGEQSITFKNPATNNWYNANVAKLNSGPGAWTTYAVFGPIYKNITFDCKENGVSMDGYPQGFAYKAGAIEAPTFPGKKLVDGEPTSVTINEDDMVVTFNYEASTFDYTLVVNGAPDGATVTIKGETVSAGSVSFDSEVTEGDVNVSGLPANYDFTVTISGTTITVNCAYTQTVITDASQISNNKLYTVETKSRGAWTMNTAGTALRSTGASGVSTSATQWAFVNYESNTYLYNVEKKTFILKDGTEAAADATHGTPVTLYKYTSTQMAGWGEDYNDFQSTQHYFSAQMGTDGNHTAYINFGGSKNTLVNGWGPGNAPDYNEKCGADAGNALKITETGEFDPTEALTALDNYFHPQYTINYVVKDETGATLFTKNDVPATAQQHITTLPEEYQRSAFYTYNTVDVTISQTVTEIEFTATQKEGAPFQFTADASAPVWYNLTIRPDNSAQTAYPTFVDGGTPNVTLPATLADDETTQWAFIGSPYGGFQIVNKAAGTNLVLGSASAVGDGGNTHATLGTGQKYELWTITASSLATNGFFINNGEGDTGYLNRRSNDNLAYWTGGHDIGSTFVATKILTDEEKYQELIALLESYPYGSEPNKFTLTVGGEDKTAEATSLFAALKNAGYSADNMATAQSYLAGIAIYQPQAGFYRIKGLTSGKYLSTGDFVKDNGVDKFPMTDDATGTNTIFCFDGTKLINYGDGMVNGMNKDVWAWVYGNGEVSTVTFGDGETNGGYTIKSANAYFYDKGIAASCADRGQTLNDAGQYRKWYLEAVTELPITLKEAECKDGQTRWFSTFAAPVSVASVEGADIHKVTDMGTYVQVEPANVTGIPAGTAVLLVSETDPATLSEGPKVVLGNYTSIAGIKTALSPLYACEKGMSGLFFGKNAAGTVGFFPLDSETKTGGFKAYLSNEGSGAKELVFGNEATGVETIDNGQLTIDNSAVYNLQGQRVNKAQKGVYIQNGKKVVLK